MRDLKAELIQLVEAGKVQVGLIDLKSYQFCIEAITRAIAAEELCNDYQDRAVMAENQVKGLQEENARLTAQVAGMRGAATEYLYAMSDSKAGIAVEINAKQRLTEILNSPDPGEKYRANCIIANKEYDGKCLGYSHGESDDEPIEQCKLCAKYTGNNAALEGGRHEDNPI